MRKELSYFISMLITGILIFGTSACDKDKDCCVLVDVNVDLLYKNAQGENLINSEEDFEASKIKVYYKKGNEFEYAFNANLDAPNMHRLGEDGNGNLILTVYPSDYYEGNQSTTLIELNPNVVDTLVGEFNLENGSRICTKAWLNGLEMENRFLIVEK